MMRCSMVYIKSNPDQTRLLPVDIRAIIPKSHICYLIEEVVNDLDYSEFDKQVEGAGSPSYHPRIALKLLLNGVCDRVTSTRKLEKLTNENIVYMYLAEGQHPDFHTIAMFRKRNSELIKCCFLATIAIAKKLDLINFNKLYLDGTKIKANASKSKTFTKEEIEYLNNFIDESLKNMDKTDDEEDQLYDDTKGEPKIPEHLTHKSKLREKIKQIREQLKGEKGVKTATRVMKKTSARQINLTDPDSALLRMKKGHFEQGYNAQIVVEDKGEFVVCNYLSNSPTDVGETIPTIEKLKEEQEISLQGVEMFQDNGYSSPATAEYYAKAGAIAYIPDVLTTQILHGKKKSIEQFHHDNFILDLKKNEATCPRGHIMPFHRKKIINRNNTGRWTNVYRCGNCPNCPSNVLCIPRGADKKYKFIEINPYMYAIRQRFKEKVGVEKYNKRFHKGEIANAHILHNLGYRSFQTKGIESCKNELNMMCIAYNLKKLHLKAMDALSKFRELFIFERLFFEL